MEQKCFKELANLLFFTNTVVVCASSTLIIIIIVIIIPCVSQIVTLQTESLFGGLAVVSANMYLGLKIDTSCQGK